MSETQGAVSREEELRANTYGLLGNLLARVPDRDMLDRLAAIETTGSEQGNGMAAAWTTLAMAARRATLEAVDDEYHALFIGIGRGELVPYGSWYLTGFLMERPLAALRQDLKALGFERREDVKEPEDHAGALMETMCMLILSGDAVSDHEQKRFFERHLEPWIGKFFEDLQNANRANFYAAVGVLGAQFVELEKQYLAMLPH